MKAAWLAALLAACSSGGWPGGIQAVLRRHGTEALVVTGVPGGSASDRAGLREGDRITAIDGEPVSGRRTAEVIDDLRGAVGTRVRLDVRRGRRRVRVVVERGPYGERFGAP